MREDPVPFHVRIDVNQLHVKVIFGPYRPLDFHSRRFHRYQQQGLVVQQYLLKKFATWLPRPVDFLI